MFRSVSSSEYTYVIESNKSIIFDWIEHYVWPHWNIYPGNENSQSPNISVFHDSARYTDLQEWLDNKDKTEVVYFGAHSYRTKINHQTIIYSPLRNIIYIYNNIAKTVMIVGSVESKVSDLALSAARIIAGWIRFRLESQGWILVHCSAVANKDRGLAILGSKGSGKTTLALHLMRQGNWHFLSNDKCFIRISQDKIQMRSTPEPIAVGLGLLNALDWVDTISGCLDTRRFIHPSQNEMVLHALRDKRTEPIYNRNTEQKYYLFAYDLHELFGFEIVSQSTLSETVFPILKSHGKPEIIKMVPSQKDFNKHVLSLGGSNLLLGKHPSERNVSNFSRELCSLLTTTKSVQVVLTYSGFEYSSLKDSL